LRAVGAAVGRRPVVVRRARRRTLMRVLQVTPYYPPTWAFGGIPRVVHGLSQALVREGLGVTVLTTDAGGAGGRITRPGGLGGDGVRVITVPNLSNRVVTRHQLLLPQGVHAALDGVEVDLVHLHGHRHLLNTAALRWARAKGVPYVFTPNGTLPRVERKRALKWVWDLAISGRVPAGAARCVAVSGAEVAALREAGVAAERICRIPNGLDLGEFDPLPPRGGARRAHGLGDGPLVVYLGQIAPRKGVDHLIEAFRSGAPAGATLVIAGPDMGGLAAALARAAGAPSVRFLGLLEGEARLELLADADVLVYAGHSEVFGLVPFEGLLCGAPVVVADDCGCGEIIREAGAGLLVRYGDLEGLRARIGTLLEDRAAAAAMVRRGRRFIHDRLSFEVVAREHARMYREVIGARDDLARGGAPGR